jgi:hypothetical protein
MNCDCLRLARLSVPAKLLVTLFVLLVGPGYLVATLNIYVQHQDADGEEGMSLDDLKRKFHGIQKTIQPDATIEVKSSMLDQVQPDGDMREYLDQGGEAAVRGLFTWLEDKQAAEADFATAGLAEEGDPSAQQILTDYCIECHNSDGGDAEDYSFADSAEAEPDLTLVMDYAEPEITKIEAEATTIDLKPTNEKKLILITHQHILSIPVFTLLVGALFLMTGFGTGIKLVLGPLPMLAVMLDIGSWWLARYSEPFIYVIAASGAIFGAAYGLQILCVLCSTWCGRREDPAGGDS